MSIRSFFTRLPVRLAGVALLVGLVLLPLLAELRHRAVAAIILDQARMQAMATTATVVTEVSAVQQTVEKLLRYVATDLENRGDLTPAQIERIVRNVLAVSPNVYGCGISFEPYQLDAASEHFGLYLHRKGNALVKVDFADPSYQHWTKDWYREVLRAQGVVWSEPFYDEHGADANVVRAGIPFYRTVNGRRFVVGVVSMGVELGWLKQVAGRNLPFESGFVMIFSRSGRLISHPQEAFIIRETMDSLAKKTQTPELAWIRQQVLAGQQGALTYFSGALKKYVHVCYKPSWGSRGGGVVVGFERDELLEGVAKLRPITMVTLATTVVLFGVVVGVVTFLFLRPLERLTRAAEALATGDVDVAIPSARRNDEVGRLGKALEVLKGKLRAGPRSGEGR